MYSTLLALKSLNRSLKSELTNIAAFRPPSVNDQFPCGIEARFGLLALPEFNIQGPVQILDSAPSHHGCRLHLSFSSKRFRWHPHQIVKNQSIN
jgi:hypothetical protein